MSMTVSFFDRLPVAIFAFRYWEMYNGKSSFSVTDRPRSVGRGEERQNMHNDRSSFVHRSVGGRNSRRVPRTDHRARRSSGIARSQGQLLRTGEKTANLIS